MKWPLGRVDDCRASGEETWECRVVDVACPDPTSDPTAAHGWLFMEGGWPSPVAGGQRGRKKRPASRETRPGIRTAFRSRRRPARHLQHYELPIKSVQTSHHPRFATARRHGPRRKPDRGSWRAECGVLLLATAIGEAAALVLAHFPAVPGTWTRVGVVINLPVEPFLTLTKTGIWVE